MIAENLTKTFTAASLFCGAGGLDLGFERAGFKTVWANDTDADACETHRNWSGAEVVRGDVSKLNVAEIPDTDVILGSCPCQAVSVSGARRLDDPRNALYRYYVEIVRRKRPLAFVSENVKGILTMDGGKLISAIINDFSDCGYDVFYRLVNAKNYGVPQDRERVVIVGFRKDLRVDGFALPETNGERRTLLDALGNLPPAKECKICRAAYSPRYMSRNRKRGWNEPSYTIPAMAKQVTLYPGSPDMVRLDKDRWRFGDGGETRRLSWREAAAIQTFPPDFEFCGGLDSVYRQIGNAVPVRLAEFVARQVRPYLEQAA
ncbi:MAG: DNA cytosine methyltransferase [Oscillospiraceae bacterium]|nr:DNA cytosine methyltransferase [Oscillospiraceae bacterium]